jgi:hypothetical protein
VIGKGLEKETAMDLPFRVRSLAAHLCDCDRLVTVTEEHTPRSRTYVCSQPVGNTTSTAPGGEVTEGELRFKKLAWWGSGHGVGGQGEPGARLHSATSGPVDAARSDRRRREKKTNVLWHVLPPRILVVPLPGRVSVIEAALFQLSTTPAGRDDGKGKIA